MQCVSICNKYKKSQRYNTPNSKYCPHCNIFLEILSEKCPCCTHRLRHKPKCSRNLKKYRENYPAKIPKRID